MDSAYYVRCIVEGMELYMRTLGLADGMHHQEGDIEWIAPLPGHAGPSCVFRVALDESTAAERIDALIPRIEAGEVPSWWFPAPLSTPGNIVDILIAKGFQDLSDPQEPEPGMAMDLEGLAASPVPAGFEITRVQSPSTFAAWVDVVNEVLHGWAMLDVEHYYSLVSRDGVSFYLALRDGTPIATAATMDDGERASLEFVSTLPGYRRQGVATAVCLEALRRLRRLRRRDVKTVTLRGSHQAVPMYRRMGFRPYYNVTAMVYRKP